MLFEEGKYIEEVKWMFFFFLKYEFYKREIF